MTQFKTLNEIKLQRQFLRKQLQVHEDNIKLHSEELALEYRRMIIKKVVEKGIVSILKFFMERKRARKENEDDE